MESPQQFPITFALQGLGSAGRSRLKAAQELSSIVQCAGVISRRPDQGTLPLATALKDPQIKAVSIATENTHHPQAVRQALEAGKHVLCDYPLSWRATEAKELYQLARQKKLILHVEHLSLITQAHQAFKKMLQTFGDIKNGQYHFKGGWNAKWADPNYRGPLSIVAYPRLMQIADWLGPFSIIEKSLSETPTHAHIQLKLKLAQGGEIDFLEERQAGLKRQRSFSLQGPQDKLNWDSNTGTSPIETGLFTKDLKHFCQRIQQGGPTYYQEALSLGVIEELEKCEQS